MMASEWKMNAQNWAMNPAVGLQEFLKGAYEYNDNDKDVLLQVWIDFYRHDEQNFVRNCVKLGIDGVMVNRDSGDGHHIIVYNPSIIELIDKKVR